MKRPKPQKSIVSEMRCLSEMSTIVNQGEMKVYPDFVITAMCYGAVLALGWVIGEGDKPSEQILARALKR